MYNHGEQPTVSARALHTGLSIRSNFTTWFDRMCEYGFTEVDYKKCFPNLESGCNGGQNRVDYLISVDMAKQICMIQRSPEGKRIRQYFIDLEKAWNRKCRNMIRINYISWFNGGNATDLPPTEMYRIGVYKVLKSELLKNSGFYKLCKSVQERTTSLKL